MYALLAVATLLFSLQFLFNRQFTRLRGNGFDTVLCFNVSVNFLGMLIMTVISGFKLKFTLFAVLIAVISSINGFICSFFSIKAFAKVDLSVYSVFMMLGGMALPFLYGIIFNNEEMGIFKSIGMLIMLISILLTLKFRGEKSGILYCIGIFITNGLSGVYASIHQASAYTIDSASYNFCVYAAGAVICTVIMLCKYKKIFIPKPKEAIYAGGFSLFTGVGSFFLITALTVLPSSVQFPIVTGGCIFFSTAVSIIMKEKPDTKTIISALLALVASVLVAF